MSELIEINLKNDTYELVIASKIPNIPIKNELNFRIRKIINHENNEILDPIITNSKYIFKINYSFIDKNVYFFFSFNKDEFEKIKELTIGLCHEKISWIKETFITINNSFFKNVLSENIIDINTTSFNEEIINSIAEIYNTNVDKINHEEEPIVLTDKTLEEQKPNEVLLTNFSQNKKQKNQKIVKKLKSK
jgi:hypothetical protein